MLSLVSNRVCDYNVLITRYLELMETSSLEKTTVSPEVPGTLTDETPTEPHGFFTEIFQFSLIALLIIVPVRIFIAQPFIVSGASMETTFSGGQYLIVDQLSYQFDDPHRGDVIIFKYPKDPSKFFIKRVIGIPGDTVSVEGNTVSVSNESHPDAVIYEEPYVHAMTPLATPLEETLGDGEYFVMGDNRDHSSDSRVWGILPEENIVGRAYLRLFPFSKINILPGSYDQESAFINPQ